jgi:phenazine biosynthesis protein phzE
MVVDEELKMMCDICSTGGQVLGPFLKPMSRLIHTEYLLAGHTDRDPREVLRDTMFAATVTGSPVENAVRLIKKYEPEGRGYYAGALALFGRTAAGAPTVDSPIVIRTADVSLDGRLTVTAGATLVRDSSPASEVAETHAKAAGILSAFGLGSGAAPIPDTGILELVTDEDVLIELNKRNRRLSSFWLADQGGEHLKGKFAGKTAVILEGGDDFAKMIRHVLLSLGVETDIVRHTEYAPGCLDGYDLVILGPGPGDPRSSTDPKITQLRAVAQELIAAERSFLAVCLGHQVLADVLGFELVYKDIVFQGTQAPVTLTIDQAPVTERVGFYNTFVGRRFGAAAQDDSVRVDASPETGDINAIWGPRFAGIQFHAESILTEHGFAILHDIVAALLR